jgi:hypothetical protein
MNPNELLDVKLPGATLHLRANVGEPLTAAALVNHLAGDRLIPLGDGPELEVDLDAADRRLWITGWRTECSWRAASPTDDSAPDADHEPGILAGWQRPEFDDSTFYGAMSPAMAMLGPNVRWSWTRTHLFVPEECQGRPLTLVLGGEGVFDLAFTRIYLNGHLVATRTVDPAEPWHELGRFDIGPGSAVGQHVRYGQDNVLALQLGPQIERTAELDAVDPLHVRHLSHRHHYAQYEQYVVVGTDRRPVTFQVASVTPADGEGSIVVALESPEGIAAEVRYAANPHGAGVVKTCVLQNAGAAPLRVLDVRLGRYRTGLNAVGHADVGFPVYVDDQLVATLMHPAGWVRSRDGEVLLEQHPARELEPGDRFECMAALLVPAEPGQARAAFREQVRARMRRVTRGHDRAYAIYESFGAWTTTPEAFIETFTDEVVRQQIACLARFHEETGEKFDVFHVDFWHNIHGDLDQPHPRRFPEGFANVKRLLAERQVSLGLWLDSTQGAWNIGGNPAIWPCTTYDHAYAVRRDPSPTQGFNFLCLTADPFRSLMTNGFRHHLRHNGARMFKFDNFNTVCYNPTHGHWPGLYSTEAICEAAIAFLQALDRECPELFLILYWGWRSPWWLLHGDTLFECGLAMEAASPGSAPTLYVRDGVTQVLDMGQWYATDIPALGKDSLGIWFSDWGWNSRIGAERWEEGFVMDMARGSLLAQPWANEEFLDPAGRRQLAEFIALLRVAPDCFAQSRFVLGNPWRAEMYGYSCPGKERAFIAVHNATWTDASVTLELNAAWGLPGRGPWDLYRWYPQSARLTAADGEPFRDRATLVLRPFEVVLLEVVPAGGRPSLPRELPALPVPTAFAEPTRTLDLTLRGIAEPRKLPALPIDKADDLPKDFSMPPRHDWVAEGTLPATAAGGTLYLAIERYLKDGKALVDGNVSRAVAVTARVAGKRLPVAPVIRPARASYPTHWQGFRLALGAGARPRRFTVDVASRHAPEVEVRVKAYFIPH